MADDNQGAAAAKGKVVLDPENAIEFNNVPAMYASGVQGAHIANDYILTFTGTRTGTGRSPDGQALTAIQIVPILDMTVSVMTLKEMARFLTRAIDEYEAEHGAITTPHLKARGE